MDRCPGCGYDLKHTGIDEEVSAEIKMLDDGKIEIISNALNKLKKTHKMGVRNEAEIRKSKRKAAAKLSAGRTKRGLQLDGC